MASFYNNYYQYYRPYLSKNYRPPIASSKNISAEDNVDFHNSAFVEKTSNKNSSKQEKSSKYYSFGPINFKNPFFNDIEEPIFEILGIELYLDDIIILGLLFFLYQEGVQDQMLYISLILLLLG